MSKEKFAYGSMRERGRDVWYGMRGYNKVFCEATWSSMHGRTVCLGIQSSDTRKSCHVNQPFTIRLKVVFKPKSATLCELMPQEIHSIVSFVVISQSDSDRGSFSKSFSSVKNRVHSSRSCSVHRCFEDHNPPSIIALGCRERFFVPFDASSSTPRPRYLSLSRPFLSG